MLGGMRRVLTWSEDDISGLSDAWGLARILTEVDTEGTVLREIGFDATGNIVHRHPGSPSKASRGIFEGAAVTASATSDTNPTEFDRFWIA
jgi:hypothetical protein